jgi:hypothetical protein
LDVQMLCDNGVPYEKTEKGKVRNTGFIVPSFR